MLKKILNCSVAARIVIIGQVFNSFYYGNQNWGLDAVGPSRF